MKYNKLYISIVLLIATTLPLFAQEPTSREQIEHFLNESGIGAQVEDIPSFIDAMFQIEEQRFEPEVRSQIRQRLNQALDPYKIKEDAISYVLLNNELMYSNKVLQWLDEPLTQRMIELELYASSDEAEEHRTEFVQNIEEGQFHQDRIDTIVAFNNFTRESDNMVLYITDLYLFLSEGMSPYTSEEDKSALKDKDTLKQMMFDNLRDQYRDVTIFMNLYTYRDVTDEDLYEYFEFYKMPEGRWFSDISFGVYEHVLSEATKRIQAINDSTIE